MHTRFAKTEAVVLNSVRFGDGHKIINLLTQGYGKVEASAFGVRKTKSRFGSRLEPFTIACILLYRKSEEGIFTIREVDVIQSNSAIREELYRFILGSCMIEPVIRFVERGEADRNLYTLLADSLRALDGIELSRGIFLLSMFEIKLLAALGYSPDVGACRKCGARVEKGAGASYDQVFGTPICDRCRTPSSMALTDGAFDFFAWALEHEPGEARRVTMKAGTLESLRGAIESLYVLTFHKKPQSWRQLSELALR